MDFAAGLGLWLSMVENNTDYRPTTARSRLRLTVLSPINKASSLPENFPDSGASALWGSDTALSIKSKIQKC